MKATSEKIEAYNEAKMICSQYKNYAGDKRSFVYKRLEHSVIDCFMNRMNSLAKQIGLLTYQETFYK